MCQRRGYGEEVAAKYVTKVGGIDAALELLAGATDTLHTSLQLTSATNTVVSVVEARRYPRFTLSKALTLYAQAFKTAICKLTGHTFYVDVLAGSGAKETISLVGFCALRKEGPGQPPVAPKGYSQARSQALQRVVSELCVSLRSIGVLRKPGEGAHLARAVFRRRQRACSPRAAPERHVQRRPLLRLRPGLDWQAHAVPPDQPRQGGVPPLRGRHGCFLAHSGGQEGAIVRLRCGGVG